MPPDQKREIRHLPLFCDMLLASFEALMQSAETITCASGDRLIEQGEPADYLHVVLEGAIELYARWRDRESTMAVVGPAGTFILAACIRDAPYLMSARALGRARLVRVPASDLRAVFRRDPEFAVCVIQELAGAYRSVVRHAKGLKLRTSRERIASYLLRQSRQAGDLDTYVLSVEKRLLASYLGMTPENLSRALRSLEDHGLKLDGLRVTITDRTELAAIASPDWLIDGPDPEGATGGVGLPPVASTN
ncbi:cyclic nucleotide-binding domain-containing protein [Salinarimonas sp. NSM]|uniref:cyclic nucleotide-binding domain-containing protein n=1 Tax=Salinarimonas sp. NSM TaxID=3458003 RepID=UPI004035890A